MSLAQWLANRWLTKQIPSREEIADLLALTERDLRDSRQAGLSADRRLSCAYGAALEAAAAALSAEGYRAAGASHHYYTIQSLAHTIGADASLVRQVDDLRRKRNTAEYERAGAVSDAEAEQAIALAARLREDVIQWLRNKHPMLLQK